MAEVEGIVKGGAEDHAAGAEGILRQGGEDAAGGGGQADGVVLHPGGVGRREDAVRRSRAQDGAGGGAAAALAALVGIDPRAAAVVSVAAAREQDAGHLVAVHLHEGSGHGNTGHGNTCFHFSDFIIAKCKSFVNRKHWN